MQRPPAEQPSQPGSVRNTIAQHALPGWLFLGRQPLHPAVTVAGIALLVLALALLPLPMLGLMLPLIAAVLLAALDPIYGLCLVLLSVPIQEVVHLPGGLSYTQAAMILAVAASGIGWFTRPQRITVPKWPLLLWLAFLWVLLFATTRTPFSLTAALKETLRWAESFVIWLLVIALVRQPRHVVLLVACLLLAPFSEALFGLWQFVTGSGPPSFRIAAGLPFVRAYGTIGQPNSLAGYLNMGWPLAFALALGTSWQLWRNHQGRRTGQRLALVAGLWFLAGALLAALLASFSRGAWLGAAVGLGGMAIALGGRARWVALLALGIGLLALVLGGIGFLPAALAGRLLSIFSYLIPFDASTVTITPANFAVVERMSQIQAGWRMFLGHPLSGVGPGNFSIAYPAFAVEPWYVSRGHAHNYYVHMLAETGLVGTLAYLGLLGSLILQAQYTLRSVQSATLRSITIGCCGIMAAVVGHDMFENLHVLSMGIQLAAVWGLLGVLPAIAQRPHRNQQPTQTMGE